MSASPLNPIPEDTQQMALEVYGSSQPYIAFGNQAEFVLRDLEWNTFSPSQSQPKGYLALLALASLFQYAEGLNDRQTASATGQRLDWKYALHLPLAYPGIAALALCVFRQRLALYPASHPIFVLLIQRLAELGIFSACSSPSPEVADVLAINCLRSCLDRSAEALSSAIESLASAEPAWLSRQVPAHWYSRSIAPREELFTANTSAELTQQLTRLLGDIRILVDAVRAQPDLCLDDYPEVTACIDVWEEMVGMGEDLLPGPSPGSPSTTCARCANHPTLKSIPIDQFSTRRRQNIE